VPSEVLPDARRVIVRRRARRLLNFRASAMAPRWLRDGSAMAPRWFPLLDLSRDRENDKRNDPGITDFLRARARARDSSSEERQLSTKGRAKGRAKGCARKHRTACETASALSDLPVNSRSALAYF